MTEGGEQGPGSASDTFLATVRDIAGGIGSDPLKFVVVIGLLIVFLVALLASGLSPLARLIMGLVAICLISVLCVVALRDARSTTPVSVDETVSADEQAPSPEPQEVVIGDDGLFVGGDDVTVEVVVALVGERIEDRVLRVRATPLEDRSYKVRFPQQFVRLRSHVRAYELSAGRLMRGCVHYLHKWDEAELAEALIELRSIELPARRDREMWFVWPNGEPKRVVAVYFDEADVGSVRTGFYRDDYSDRVPDLPQEEPIWLAQIWPRIIWARVVPAVIAHRRAEYPGPEDPPALDITEWVLSDRRPTELARVSPSTDGPGPTRAKWAW